MTTLEELPAASGSYALILQLAALQPIAIGAMGVAQFPAGIYIYLGSARGPGGIRARLGRHLQGGGTLHWHIDYLRAHAQVVESVFQVESTEKAALIPTECRWSQVLAQLPQARIPLAKFGARDCHHGCPAHLIQFPPDFDISNLHVILSPPYKSESQH